MEEIRERESMDESYTLLYEGKAPGQGPLLEQLSTGIDFITDFWKKTYLQEYICRGGSKVKFVTGRPGSGKTHMLQLLSSIAQEENYVTVDFSAADIWLHDFKEIYAEIFRQSHIMECLDRCRCRIVENMGFEVKEIPKGLTFMDYLSQNDLGDAITKREIRLQLKTMFLENPLIDNNFALICSLITGGLLGHPILEEQNRELLLSWLEGDKTTKLTSLRALGLSSGKITRFNARHMLRSLSEVVRLAGYSGLFVTIDNLEILLNRSGLQSIHYTRIKREDAYESIRQMVDDIDSLKNIMIVLGFERELLDQENTGIKSYQALWMRIQNEISGENFNRFTDIVDLDRLAAQQYTPEVLMEMSKKLADLCRADGHKGEALSREACEALLRQASMGGISIPRLINQATLGGES